MKNEFSMMIPNDHWFIDRDDIWLVNRNTNELYRGSFSTFKFEYVSTVSSDEEVLFRLNPLCVKYDNYIIELPDKGKYAWIYDVERKEHKRLEIDNPCSVVLGIYWCGIFEKGLWAWSRGLKRLIKIDLESMHIKYYKISEDEEEIFSYQVNRVQNNIYIFSSFKKILYKFDVISEKINEYVIPNIGDGINTICYSEGMFWFSGFDDRIYIWNEKTENLETIIGFSKEFIITKIRPVSVIYQGMLFYQSVCLEKYICFIPWNFPETVCNSVLFVNKESYEMKVVKLYDENDDGKGEYTFEYVIDGRYIGIYYSRNVFVSEIDTFDFTIKEKAMQFSLDSYTKVLKPKLEKANTLMEETDADLPAFINL